MLSVGDAVPTVSAPLANGNIDELVLPDDIDGAAVVLAFFPGAFTEVCCHEMSTLQDRLDEFQATGARVYGVSVDTPFALNAFRDDLGLDFGLVSDSNRRLVDAFGISMDFTALGVDNVAKRAVFVLEEQRTVTYRWVAADPAIEPDYDDVLSAVGGG